ncbi:hypothetical protein AVEN_218735-1 [Araneus ventricosus]|uniref:Uncharacterized protein n=1 Tax=Araneus ventricosus TaxID=182803 RepID=A0A4Y2B4A6_ARAVE|nr:hypothetical protein AVEN_218735-1 [Araneus ventricosus]
MSSDLEADLCPFTLVVLAYKESFFGTITQYEQKWREWPPRAPTQHFRHKFQPCCAHGDAQPRTFPGRCLFFGMNGPPLRDQSTSFATGNSGFCPASKQGDALKTLP